MNQSHNKYIHKCIRRLIVMLFQLLKLFVNNAETEADVSVQKQGDYNS